MFLFLEYLVYLRVSTVPVMTTLVTLEVQRNDSVSLVHARYCNYSLNFSQGGPVPLSDLASQTESTKKPVPKIPAPDMTTLVTLEVHSPGDNDSVSLVPVRIRLFLKHACALIVGTGDSSLTVYNPDTFVYIPDTYDKSYCAFYFMITYCFTVYNPDRSGKFHCTAYFSLFYVSGTKNFENSVGTGENDFTVYNPDNSSSFYCTVHFIFF